MAEAPKTVAKPRSPNYPAFDLEACIVKIRELSQKLGRHAAPTITVMKELGYSGKSSSGLQLIGALVAFGLLDSVGRGDERRLSISPIARRILHEPADSPARATAMRTAALNPAIHAAMWEKFGADLPQSDQVIRSFLILDHGFIDDAATQLIGEYRATFQAAHLDSSAPVENNESGEKLWGEVEKPMTPAVTQPTVHSSLAAPPATDGVPISVLMAKGKAQIVTIPKMTKKAFEFFKNQLDAFAEAIIQDEPTDDAK